MNEYCVKCQSDLHIDEITKHGVIWEILTCQNKDCDYTERRMKQEDDGSILVYD